MATRKKDPAKDRTVSLFTGLTPLEERERDERESAPEVKAGVDRTYDGTRADAMEVASRWIGLDVFEDGDDVMMLLGPKGDAVLVLIRAKGIYPSHQAHVRLSPKQLRKLKKVVAEL